ncbi:putative uncharacterized protein [Pseudarthrobacter siccitolerans]|uniref:DpnII restriction endonuclease family protein n=1 Tax=Pseudarthrobacter siccitolerans TaxID=861266 RepID=A0A024GXQ8_9MICC|nr:hypothetical protein [Pseudarthrobacter siccitolerans]CCQ44284.1 putative uncharacterized protein [Pseudarthrobacter siccitolerans]
MPLSIPTLDEYMATLGAQSSHPDPTIESEDGILIKKAAADLADLDEISQESLAKWISTRPRYVEALGLSVGLSKEKLLNNLKYALGTSGYVTLARDKSVELVEYLDDAFGLVALLAGQLNRDYDFGDVLVARAGTRAFAKRASDAGRKLEDEIEAIAKTLGLPYELRGTFVGRDGQEAPFDLAIPGKGSDAQIVVAAKGFDSTGSKLGDAVREIESMASVRRPNQYVMAVIDGIGWNRRKSDLAKIHDKWVSRDIDGMYTRATLGDFQNDLLEAARLRHLL